MEAGPIFLAGVDRSGIGVLGELFDSHPDLAISRRTNFWSCYHGRYGDLGDRGGLERCLAAMMRSRRMRALVEDPQQVLDAIAPGPCTYGTLFATIQALHLRRAGKRRWGDKSLGSEGHAGVIFTEFADARMIHVVRDPRDRYASRAAHRGTGRGKVASQAAQWRWSARLARRNAARYAGRYAVVRYEDLAADPGTVMRRLCAFLGVTAVPEVTSLPPAPGPGGPTGRRPLTLASVRRYERDLDARTIAFLDLVTAGPRRDLRYPDAGVRMPPADWLRLAVLDLPEGLAVMGAWALRRLEWRRPAARARRGRQAKYR